MNEIKIKLEEVHPVELLGVNNHKLKIIQDHFPELKVVSRGNELILQGNNEEMRRLNDKIGIMVQHLLKHASISEKQMHDILEKDETEPFEEGKEENVIVRGNQGRIIRAKTPNQKKLYEAVNKNDVVFAIGPAGTGKTYTSVALAVKALKEKKVRRIILTRPAVEAGENLGFLPGDLKEKIDPYLRPLYDALDEMIPPEKLRQYIEDRVIEIAPLAFMRGRTLNDAYVILDEAQNATLTQLKMFLTRMGPDAQFIVTGDLTQVDLPAKQSSGLLETLELLRPINGVDAIYLDKEDVTRHKLVRKIISAFESYQEAHEPKRNS